MQGTGLVRFHVMVKETDLWISADSDLKDPALSLVRQYRRHLEHYIRECPEFLTTLKPMDPGPDAHELIQAMAVACKTEGVGPMAAGNRVQTPGEIRKGLDFIASIPGVQGGLIIVGESMGAWGDVELVKL
mgnify:FL=1